MVARFNKFIASIALVCVLTGFAGCVFACESDEAKHDHHGGQSECHCMAHCSCHLLSLPVVQESADKSAEGQLLVSASFIAKLPVFAASIFNPPRA